MSEGAAEAGLSGRVLTGAERALVQDAAWASVIGVLSGGVVLVSFALLLGAGPFTIGLLAAVPSIGQLAQLPAIALVERIRRRRALAVWLGFAERVMVLLLAGLPFIADRTVALAVLVVAEIVIASLAAMSACAWNSWMHDLLPRQGMGGFFGRRLFWSTVVSLAGGLAAGALVDHWPGSDPAQAYAVAFAGAGLAGFVSTWFLARVPDVPMQVPAHQPKLGVLLRRPFRSARFRSLLVFMMSWSFSTNLAGPFVTVYLLQQVGLDLGTVVVLWAVSQLANAFTLNLWGQLSDRFSDKAVLRATAPMFLLCLGALAFAGQVDGSHVTIAILVAIHVALGVATGGTSLACGNIALRLAPRGEGTAFMAVIGLANAVAAGVAPLLGGLAADWLAVRQLSVTLTWTAPGSQTALGTFSMQHWQFFFVLAALLGLHALAALARVPETESTSGRILVRDIALEAARTLRSLSSFAGLRGGAGFPFGRLVRRPPTRLRAPEAGPQ